MNARAFFNFAHLIAVLVLSATWNDLFCSCVDDECARREILIDLIFVCNCTQTNLIPGPYFGSQMTWRESRNDCRNTRFHFWMTLSLSSTYSLLKFRNTMWQKQAIYVLWERYLSAVKRHCDLRFLPCCVLFENASGKYKLLHVVDCRESEWRGLKAKDLRLKQQFRDFQWSLKWR